jgi:voltage-gated potassium channel
MIRMKGDHHTRSPSCPTGAATSRTGPGESHGRHHRHPRSGRHKHPDAASPGLCTTESHQESGCALLAFSHEREPGPGPDVWHDLRLRPRLLMRSLLQALGSSIALVVLYYLLPLDESSIPVVVVILAIGLAGLVLLVAFQVRSIIKSQFPELQAVGALAMTIPLFLLLFAATYFIMDRISAGSFSEPLTRTEALYFTVTVFATVGFGDITAKAEFARVVVTGQMVLGIVIAAIGARVIVEAVRRGQQQRPGDLGDELGEQ